MDQLEPVHQQCLHIRSIGGWFDHSNRGIIEVSGADRIQFLHHILTNDVKSLTPGTGVQACLLTAQAKIITAMNVLCFDNHLWLAFDYVLKDKLREALEKLIIMEDIVLKDRSDELKLISVHGPKAKELISEIASASLGTLPRNDIPEGTAKNAVIARRPTEIPRRHCEPRRGEAISRLGTGSAIPNSLLSHASIALSGPIFPALEKLARNAEIIRINLIGEEGYGILFPRSETENVRKLIEGHASSLNMAKIEPAAMEIMRIAAGIPKYGIDYDESHIPLECRLDQTISFSKGCFPGQEIIARLDSRGGVAQKLCGLALKGEIIPKKNDRILEHGIEVGHITSATFDPTLKKTVALGYVKKRSWAVGHLVAVQTEGGQIPARIAELPFYSQPK